MRTARSLVLPASAARSWPSRSSAYYNRKRRHFNNRTTLKTDRYEQKLFPSSALHAREAFSRSFKIISVETSNFTATIQRKGLALGLWSISPNFKLLPCQGLESMFIYYQHESHMAPLATFADLGYP